METIERYQAVPSSLFHRKKSLGCGHGTHTQQLKQPTNKPAKKTISSAIKTCSALPGITALRFGGQSCGPAVSGDAQSRVGPGPGPPRPGGLGDHRPSYGNIQVAVPKKEILGSDISGASFCHHTYGGQPHWCLWNSPGCHGRPDKDRVRSGTGRSRPTSSTLPRVVTRGEVCAGLPALARCRLPTMATVKFDLCGLVIRFLGPR